MDLNTLSDNYKQLRSACCSDRGLYRGNNEDNIYFDGKYLKPESRGTGGILSASYDVPLDADESGVLFAVFDGIGGSKYGEVASYIAAHTADAFRSMILDYVDGNDPDLIVSSLDMLYEDMNIAVFHGSKEFDAYHMGTTAVSLFLYNGHAWCSNAGDSRCYLLRDGRFSRISEDHSTEPAMKALGFSGFKPQLTQYIGMDPAEDQLIASHAVLPFRRGDTFLLCSDGLTDMVSEDMICQILSVETSPEDSAAALIRTANENGGLDNISVIVIRI